MATAPAPAQWSVGELLTAIKQLSPAELREFQRQFDELRGQNHEFNNDSTDPAGEAALLARISENSGLPVPEQRHFDRLRRKRQAETLTRPEEKELQALWQRVEQMNVDRLRDLIVLARRRGTDVKTLMRDLGLSENLHVI